MNVSTMTLRRRLILVVDDGPIGSRPIAEQNLVADNIEPFVKERLARHESCSPRQSALLFALQEGRCAEYCALVEDSTWRERLHWFVSLRPRRHDAVAIHPL